MPRAITVSLPVADLARSRAFYAALGFKSDAQCSADGAALMAWSEYISLVLLTHEAWRTMTSRPIPPATSSEVALILSCDSRMEVDAMNRTASENGGTGDVNSVQDHEAMYGRDFMDPDGHVWGAMWMNKSN